MNKMETLKRMLKKDFIKTIVNIMANKVAQEVLRIHDAKFTTEKIYAEAEQKWNLLTIGKLKYESIDIQKARELWRMYSSHRFDLLGSGWVENGYGSFVNGFEGKVYTERNDSYVSIEEMINAELRNIDVSRAQRIWKNISFPYQPIDWQKDYKSGYRWSAKKWYRPQEIAKKPGGDIKVPWELSRLQHLPRLAMLTYVLPEEKVKIQEEFQNQILDFIAMNPLRFGVNYMCTMDVGIRNANIVLAYCLFKQTDCVLEEQFEKIVINYIFESCEFIFNNLEWSYYLTSNHYFANLAGLLYGSAILPECKKQKKWLKFAVLQIQQEIRKQFSIEGSNLEGSTAYHRLMGEMALYSVALIENLAQKKKCEECPQDIYEILYRAACFTSDITRPDGSFTQIGDNDSGVFFRLSITGNLLLPSEAIKKYYNLRQYRPMPADRYYLDENMNDGRTFVSSAAGMFEEKSFEKSIKAYPLECSLVEGIRGKPSKHNVKPKGIKVIITKRQDRKYTEFNENKIYFNGSKTLDGIRRIDYPNFGLYLFKSPSFYLCINATDNGQKGNAGHAHNDKLSFELFEGNQCRCEDPGNYVYTADAESRNRYRSTLSHNGVFLGEEQNRYNGLFSMYNDTRCFILSCADNEIEAEVVYRGYVHTRKFVIEEDGLKIIDKTNRIIVSKKENVKISRGYGKIENDFLSRED